MKSIALSKGLHDSGTTKKSDKKIILKGSWKYEVQFTIKNNKGISELDGQGGDGLWITVGGSNGLKVKFDTWKNLENYSGNEVLFYVEQTKVAQNYCKTKFNSGKQVKATVIYDDKLKTVICFVEGEPVLAYAFSDLDLYDTAEAKEYVEFSSFTGDAGGDHYIDSFKFTSQ